MALTAVNSQIILTLRKRTLAKFDLPTIIGLIYGYCKIRDYDFQTLKKGTKYITGVIKRQKGERTAVIAFRDCLNYTAPCSLDKYCRQWGARLQKSIFPYSLYGSVEELHSATEFPSYEDFYSDLKQVSLHV